MNKRSGLNIELNRRQPLVEVTEDHLRQVAVLHSYPNGYKRLACGHEVFLPNRTQTEVFCPVCNRTRAKRDRTQVE